MAQILSHYSTDNTSFVARKTLAPAATLLSKIAAIESLCRSNNATSVVYDNNINVNLQDSALQYERRSEVIQLLVHAVIIGVLSHRATQRKICAALP